MLKVWPNMNKKTKDGLKDTFNRVRAYKAEFEPCDKAEVSGDATTATVTCTEAVSYNREGKFQPATPIRVSILLRKTSSGTWQIEDMKGKQ
jgi:hypothetical protein